MQYHMDFKNSLIWTMILYLPPDLGKKSGTVQMKKITNLDDDGISPQKWVKDGISGFSKIFDQNSISVWNSALNHVKVTAIS